MKTIKIVLLISGFVIFFISMFLVFEPSTDPTGFFTYVPGLAIINYDNHIPLNSNLEIGFMTIGTNDLTITSLGNMEFIELRCGEGVLMPSVKDNIIKYNDYSCTENSFLVVKVLSKELELEFKFGNRIQQAQNTVS